MAVMHITVKVAPCHNACDATMPQIKETLTPPSATHRHPCRPAVQHPESRSEIQAFDHEAFVHATCYSLLGQHARHTFTSLSEPERS